MGKTDRFNFRIPGVCPSTPLRDRDPFDQHQDLRPVWTVPVAEVLRVESDESDMLRIQHEIFCAFKEALLKDEVKFGADQKDRGHSSFSFM